MSTQWKKLKEKRKKCVTVQPLTPRGGVSGGHRKPESSREQ